MGNVIGGLLYLSIIIGGIYGWIMNIVQLVQNDIVWTSGMSIGRIIGIFVAPLGAVLGYF
jgi:hypothetical protein